MKKDTDNKLSGVSVTMHWVVGLGMIGLLASGIYMAETKYYAMYPWHKAIGFLILFFAVARASWRLYNGLPKPLNGSSKIAHKAASAMHWALLAATILMPLSGMAMSILGGHGLNVFGWDVAAKIENPSEIMMTLAVAGKTIHTFMGYALIALVGLHGVAALKHHIINKDGTLMRMLGKSINA